MVMPFQLNLRHLRAIGAIIQKGGMNVAAEAIGLSQPALTQGVSKLETQLGLTLFERRPKGMVPTAAAYLVARRVEAAFDHLAASTRRARRGRARPERLMTAAQLRAFLALADGGSFVSAAQATGLSQPALHRSVRDLEEVTGDPLLERRGRGIALTHAGRKLARGIRLAAAEIAAAIAEARPDGETSRIVIGAMPLSRALLVPRAVAPLLAERPGVSVSIVEGSWRELVEPLRDGQIDLMIGALRPTALPDLDQVPLHDHRVVIVAGARHPLAGIAAVPLERLAAFPWIVGHAGSPLRIQWEKMFEGHPAPASPIECGSVMVMRGLLVEGDFLTLLSPEQIALEVESGLLAQVAGPMADNVRRIGVTTRRDWRPTAAQRRFLDHLAAAAETSEFSFPNR